MMIYVNARFLTQAITGVQRFALEISRALKQADESIRFICPTNVLHHAWAQELRAEPVGRLHGHLWEQIELPLALRFRGRPLLLSLGTSAPVAYSRKIVTIHDLAFLRFPDAVSKQFALAYRILIPQVIRTSLHLTTVSEYSRRDIMKTYRPRAPMDVIYNATTVFNEPPAQNRERFVLAVGSLQPYKNLEALIAAFVRMKAAPDKADFRLVIAGGADRAVFRRTGLAASVGTRTDIELTGYVSDEELATLYRTATLFVFPSLYEGFGIPPLEAMAHSCPVLASTAASIPEVCSDAASYFDPLDVEDLASKMAHLLDDASLRRALVAKGRVNLQRFDWNASAQKLLALARRYDRTRP